MTASRLRRLLPSIVGRTEKLLQPPAWHCAARNWNAAAVSILKAAIVAVALAPAAAVAQPYYGYQPSYQATPSTNTSRPTSISHRQRRSISPRG